MNGTTTRRALLALVMLAILAAMGCGATGHGKALGRLKDACKIYMKAEGMAAALNPADYIKRDDLAEDVELGRRINRSACHAIEALADRQNAEADAMATKLLEAAKSADK